VNLPVGTKHEHARYLGQVLGALRTWHVDSFCDFHACVDSQKVDVELLVELPELVGVMN
jgi:hypothetical protein